MRERRHSWILSAIVMVGLLTAACASREPAADSVAEPPPPVSPAPTEVTKTIFAQHDADSENELYLYEVIIPAGEEIAAHDHPGLQMAHIMEGSLEYQIIDGTALVLRKAGTPDESQEEVSGETVILETGDGVIENVGMVHQARNPGTVPTRILLASYFPRGAEMSSPVPQPSPTV